VGTLDDARDYILKSPIAKTCFPQSSCFRNLGKGCTIVAMLPEKLQQTQRISCLRHFGDLENN
jgi:hypothetical protein